MSLNESTEQTLRENNSKRAKILFQTFQSLEVEGVQEITQEGIAAFLWGSEEVRREIFKQRLKILDVFTALQDKLEDCIWSENLFNMDFCNEYHLDDSGSSPIDILLGRLGVSEEDGISEITHIDHRDIEASAYDITFSFKAVLLLYFLYIDESIDILFEKLDLKDEDRQLINTFITSEEQFRRLTPLLSDRPND